MYHVCHAFLSVHFSLVVTCLERADLLALLYVMFYSVFCHFSLWCPGSGYLYLFIRFGSKLYRQIVGIPMGTNCAPLVADFFLVLL